MLKPVRFVTCYLRGLLISWLLKDLGWMTTNVYLGWCFGGIAVILHILVLVIDWPYNITFRFYHSSLVLWIIGNFMWMSVEFMVYKESSDIHFGPHTPVGGLTVEQGDKLTVIKSYFFLAGIFIQLLLFVLIHLGWLEMPSDTDSDIDSEHQRGGQQIDDTWSDGGEGDGRVRRRTASRGDEVLLVEAGQSSSSGDADVAAVAAVSDIPRQSADEAHVSPSPNPDTHPLGFTLTFIENGYIVLWISKDYFWSWATGDFEVDRGTGYFTGT